MSQVIRLSWQDQLAFKRGDIGRVDHFNLTGVYRLLRCRIWLWFIRQASHIDNELTFPVNPNCRPSVHSSWRISWSRKWTQTWSNILWNRRIYEHSTNHVNCLKSKCFRRNDDLRSGKQQLLPRRCPDDGGISTVCNNKGRLFKVLKNISEYSQSSAANYFDWYFRCPNLWRVDHFIPIIHWEFPR